MNDKEIIEVYVKGYMETYGMNEEQARHMAQRELQAMKDRGLIEDGDNKQNG